MHAVVLPNSNGEVLFWCRNAAVGVTVPDPVAHGGAWGPTHTFLWRMNDPARATKKDVPNANDGSEDLFCGGQQFLANGDPIAFCGTNVPYPSVNPFGHAAAFRFDRTLGQWVTLPALNMPRWYPHGFLTTDGRLTVLGHIQEPAQWPLGSGNLIVRFNDSILDDGSGGWALAENRPYGTASLPCSGSSSPSNFVNVLDYPRAFVLAREDMLLFTKLRIPKSNYFLDLTVDCYSSSAGAFRHPWRNYLPANAGVHPEGSAAHFVTLDASNVPVDTIYAIGGEASVGTPSADVERITNPSPVTQLSWDPLVPDLQRARAHLNVVIGSLGEMYALGGEGASASPPAESPIHCVERYRTPEIFGVPDTWLDMAAHTHARTYHSVAGLLPDGRIFLAGGEEEGAHHSIEIFSPPYLFLGPRPIVDNLTLSQWSHGLPYSFDVTLRSEVTFARAHLIKLGAITHGFDSSQRFVQLQITNVLPIGTNKVRVDVLAPRNAAAAPRGHYWLIAVDTAGIPSVAQLIHIP